GTVGRAIDNQVAPYRVRGAQKQKIKFEYPAMLHEFNSGHKIRLEVDVRDPRYINSRKSDGTLIHHSAFNPSKLKIPITKGSKGALSPNDDLFDLF
ncbi:MAG: hypothetical protein SXQ77_12390, partial [Halobacteria archaeon]|nr:hypothetical protein [Halobacteria archaeon]